MTRGHHVFHSLYLEVSRRMEKIREAGAAIVVEAERVRTALLRGVVGVQRPVVGGHEGGEFVVILAM